MDDEIYCPRCKTTKYRNPSLKLMVNVCGHSLCDNCVDLLFAKGSGSCPQCNIPLRRHNFRFQVFEDASVEKEVDIRRRVLKDFNKKEDDFATLREYNDYLEEIETIVFNLVNDYEIEETKRKVDQYKKDNQELISKNRNKKSEDELKLEDLLEEEKRLSQNRTDFQALDLELERGKRLKKKQREQLVDDLMFSDMPAQQILDSHADQKKRIEVQDEQRREVEEAKRKDEEIKARSRGAFSTGIQFKGSSSFAAMPQQLEPVELYRYEPITIDLAGPRVPPVEELDADGYLLHVVAAEKSEKAGGFISVYPCNRAIQEAFCGLYIEKS